MEEWYSMTTRPVSNPSIYITETFSHITVAIQEFAVAGYDTNTPFDLNLGVPTNMTGRSNIMSATISTDDAQDMLLGFAYGGGGTINPGSGFSGICLSVTPCTFRGTSADASEYEIVTTTQSSSLVSMTQAAGLSWGFIADAVRSGSPSIIVVSPNKGTAGIGIVITGSSFTGVLSVEFCATLQPTFTVVNDTTITTIAPQLTTPPSSQTCDVSVTKSGGGSTSSLTSRFSFLPSVKSMSPTSGGNGILVTIIGTSFIGTTDVTLCGTSQARFTVINDTQIRWAVSDTGAAASEQCDVVVTNSIGSSSTSNRDQFTYTPQIRGGTTSHTPNVPTNSARILLITTAGIAVAALFLVAGSMRPRDPEKNENRQVQAQGKPPTNSSASNSAYSSLSRGVVLFLALPL